MLITPDRKHQDRSGKPQTATFPLRHWRKGTLGIILVLAFFSGTRLPTLPWLARHHLSTALAHAPEYLSGGQAWIESVLRAEPLETITIDMKFKHVARIEEQRSEAIEDGWIRTSDDDYVPATLTWPEGTADVKVRLKGDRIKHVSGDKWSLRVKAKGNERPFGMRYFSLHHPRTRNYITEWCFLQHARDEGILAVRYRFVRVVLNGEDKGIFALEEHFGKELMESHGRREGVIVALEERPSIHYDGWQRYSSGSRDIAVRLSTAESQDLRSFDSNRVASNPALVAQCDEALEMLRAVQEGRRMASDVFDVELMGRYMALVDYWQGAHAMLWQNSRFYYNPITARLEPIAFDAMALWGREDTPMVVSRDDDRFMTGPLRDPEIARVYLRELERFSTPEYLRELRRSLDPHFSRWRLALQREFFLGDDLDPPWDRLALRQEFIRNVLRPEQMVIAHGTPWPQYPNTTDALDAIRVEVRSIALLPVEIAGFRINEGQLIPADRFWDRHEQDEVLRTGDGSITLKPGTVELADQEVPRIVGFDVPVSNQPLNSAQPSLPFVEVATRFPGQSELLFREVRMMPPREPRGSAPAQPTLEAVLRQHPFLEIDGQSEGLHVRPGIWDVHGDLVLSARTPLTIGAGVTLRFEPEAILYTRGPLHLCGTLDSPVVLESSDGQWGGVVVLESESASCWEHVIVRDTGAIARGGWMLTGGVNFYRSDVTLGHVDFVGHAGEDSLNVIHASAGLFGCTFERCASDAFDGDFVTGRIIDCRFTDVQGDAVDVSGSEIMVEASFAERIGDKAISAGERSTVFINDIKIHDASIAVASKDLSLVHGQGVDIRDTLIGLAAYNKKPEFGPARIVLLDVTMQNSQERSLTQEGSSVRANGVDEQASTFDVDNLYARGILGN